MKAMEELNERASHGETAEKVTYGEAEDYVKERHPRTVEAQLEDDSVRRACGQERPGGFD